MFMALSSSYFGSQPLRCHARASGHPVFTALSVSTGSPLSRGRRQASDARFCHSYDSLNSLGVVVGLLAGAVAPQRALLADRIGALEDPVLPGGQPCKDLRFHGLGPAEAQVRLEPGEPVGREAR